MSSLPQSVPESVPEPLLETPPESFPESPPESVSESRQLSPQPCRDAALVLADGTILYGVGAGAPGQRLGELCFTTTMTGFQETLTDPSYHRQIVVFTFPHVGVVGANDQDHEHHQQAALACICARPLTEVSHYRAQQPFGAWLSARGITGIQGIDTRYLTHRLRDEGVMNAGVIYTPGFALSAETLAIFVRDVRAFSGIQATDLTRAVTRNQIDAWSQTEAPTGTWALESSAYEPAPVARYHVVVIDYGVKESTLRHLCARGARVTVVTAGTSAEAILALEPDGILLSNGPGDPQVSTFAISVARSLIETSDIPIFGICLGFQILGAALGGETHKMRTGHRGGNHPVIDVESCKVSITSQNHGYTVSASSLQEILGNRVDITHLSLFDRTLEGFELKDRRLFAVQYHPEASPGPHDATSLFEKFDQMICASLHHRKS